MAGFREVLYNDGEGLEYTDLNLAQRNARAEVLDGLIRSRFRDGSGNTFGGTGHCYSWGFGGGPKATGVALQSSNHQGVIAQAISVGPGVADPTTLIYVLEDDELVTTHAAADPTNPRVDIVCVKLEMVEGAPTARDYLSAPGATPTTSPTMDKARTVTLTKSVVAGTPAATPVEPAVPAGYVKWASVRIPAAHAGVLVAKTHMKDWRVPVGNLHVADIGTTDFLFNYATAGSQAFIMKFPRAGRLMRLRIRAKISGGGSIALYRYHTITGTSNSNSLVLNAGDTAGVETWVDLFSGGESPLDANLGPVWTRAGNGISDVEDDAVLMLIVTSGANGDYAGLVHAEIAAL
jgi:hypothetical protein